MFSGAPKAPVYGAVLRNDLIQPGEGHFKNLWMLTDGGENAEAYWNSTSDRLVMQARDKSQGIDCDRIYVTNKNPKAPLLQISNGQGVTTCSYFMPGDGSVLYASTHSGHTTCPDRPPFEQGEYVWPIWPQYDVYVQDLKTGEEYTLIENPGYDAEATVSPNGDSIVFTSTRSGDLELWTCDIDGSNAYQVTRAPGYDGGAFFSHSGDWLVFRSTAFTPGKEAEELEQYWELLGANVIKPSAMEIMIIRPDGSDRRQVTQLGGANWAPYFYPTDDRILFCTNHHSPEGEPMNFDLFACDLDGSNLERVTTNPSFDSFPMFSPDGRYLAFGSNRGNGGTNDTNVFIAEWQ